MGDVEELGYGTLEQDHHHPIIFVDRRLEKVHEAVDEQGPDGERPAMLGMVYHSSEHGAKDGRHELPKRQECGYDSSGLHDPNRFGRFSARLLGPVGLLLGLEPSLRRVEADAVAKAGAARGLVSENKNRDR